ncbi:UDP-N-acetylmuramate dehydrogenase [Tepidamorphus sp. 3E244]|uniref:UDP-N-acetylmuramate dehydrogenase n=1 Tax=Tepidamorphus sp. 3E244 TaxID=3385498 RepID=UPI0038FD324A
MHADIVPDLKAAMPELRGRLEANADLAPLTWFRVGGPAQVLYVPADVDDLAYFRANLNSSIPLTVVGVGSNLLVRDGGIGGVVVRLTRGFNQVEVLDNARLRAGAAVPDLRVAKAAAEAGISGLSFFSGIPGAIGGALRMNAGAYGGETVDVLVHAEAVDGKGNKVRLTPQEMGMSYRHTEAPADLIFTHAVLQGEPGEPETITAEIAEISERRAGSQPIKERTGGSTFANPDPPGTPDQRKSWQLIDKAGCRGLVVGDAMVSEMHCNFLINRGSASALDIERLGESVRKRVRETSGVELRWEIRRIGKLADGQDLSV